MAENGSKPSEAKPSSTAASSGSAAGAGPSPSSSSTASSSSSSKPKGNPAFRALGLPNFRLRLPSRNWSIFLTVVGTWTGLLVYDRQQKKKVQKKWCTLVSHIAAEPLPTSALARRLTVYLNAPPGDGLRVAREHFVEYIKPVLVAGAMDWDVIEGRREGDVRAGLAKRIRQYRSVYGGEQAQEPLDVDKRLAVELLRPRIGVVDGATIHGDLVIGRHTWKEYIRGLHEGWLGAMDPPKEEDTSAEAAPLSVSEVKVGNGAEATTTTTSNTDDASPTSTTADQPALTDEEVKQKAEEEEKKRKEEEERKKRRVPPAHNTPSSYASSPLSPSTPVELGPAAPVALPHILGIRNTPLRMYRFLTRRYMADEIGRQTAAAVLAAHRPFTSSADEVAGDDGETRLKERWEQDDVLRHEEREWYKRAKKRVEGEGERVWLDDMVLDPRIAERMRLFEVDSVNEERARRIAEGSAGIPGRPVEDEEEQR